MCNKQKIIDTKILDLSYFWGAEHNRTSQIQNWLWFPSYGRYLVLTSYCSADEHKVQGGPSCRVQWAPSSTVNSAVGRGRDVNPAPDSGLGAGQLVAGSIDSPYSVGRENLVACDLSGWWNDGLPACGVSHGLTDRHKLSALGTEFMLRQNEPSGEAEEFPDALPSLLEDGMHGEGWSVSNQGEWSNRIWGFQKSSAKEACLMVIKGHKKCRGPGNGMRTLDSGTGKDVVQKRLSGCREGEEMPVEI